MKKIIKFIAFTALAVAGQSAAIAADATLPQLVAPGPGVTSWDIRNTGGTDGSAFVGGCDETPGLSIIDATSANGSTDAYDYAYSIWVDGVVFDAPDPVDLTGNTITAGPVVMSDLNVSVEYAFSNVVQAGRIRAIFDNPTLNPITVTVDMPVNLGSGIDTVIEATSSGDAVFTTADRWVVTSDGDPPGEAVNTTVLWGPGATVTPSFVTSSVFSCIGSQGIGASFEITVPARDTRALMFFAGLGDIVGLDNTVAGAIANAAMFNNNGTIDASLLAGITDAELVEIVNWAIVPARTGGGGRCSIANPAGSAWQAGDMWLLLAFAACLGLWRMRCRAAPCAVSHRDRH